LSDPLTDAGDEAATPLTPDERDGLIPTYIVTRAELNEVEQIGVDEAYRWAFGRRRDMLDVFVLRQLHRRMFGDVWKWAGQYSREQKRRIGLDHWQIDPAMHQLVADVRYWVRRRTYPPDEIVVRFHHRLTQIHPFPNGNGRFSRLAADTLAVRLGRDRFSWGSGDLVEIADLRRRYVDALRAADGHDIGPLLEFVRS
jgi:Fic-DOC domain mobile mystery protein B